MDQFIIGNIPLSFDLLSNCLKKTIKLSISNEKKQSIQQSAEFVQNILNKKNPVYGINTGFGALAQKKIDIQNIKQLQHNLVISHATGTGKPLDVNIVRLLMFLKIVNLSQGYSGITLETLERMVNIFNHHIYPLIPEQGSVGASGDLAPLAHMSYMLLGNGQAIYQDQIFDVIKIFNQLGLKPIELQAKEGLALLNGTQVSTAIALKALMESNSIFKQSLITGALCVEAIKGSHKPFDARIHQLRPYNGQQKVATILLNLLSNSEINKSHANCAKVQDPYSVRCVPQVIGACFDQWEFAKQQLLTEANSVTDNPLIFLEQGDVLSGGNFHAQPVAFACDTLALAIAEVGALAERRIALMLDSHMSGLPPFLINDSGMNSGMMIAQVTAAALVSENKTLSHPASVDSLPTNANQEDHVSMATWAARKLNLMVQNTRKVIAIELMVALQALEFHHPLKTSQVLEKIRNYVKQHITISLDQDRFLSDDIQALDSIIIKETLLELASNCFETN